MTRPFKAEPAPNVARTIRGDERRPTSDLGRTVQVRLATEEFRATDALFSAVRALLETHR